MNQSPTPPTTEDSKAAEPHEVLVSLYQSGQAIYAKAVDGLFSKWRWAAVWITQIVFTVYRGWTGTHARPFYLTWKRAVFTSLAWCCIRKT